MSSPHGGRTKRTLVLLVALVSLLAVALPSVAQAGDQKLRVMTRNLYLGTGLDNVVSAPNQAAALAAVTQDWFNVVATDFPVRAHALADEIRLTKPDLIGLQEVTWWRDGAFDGVTNPPNAANTRYEFLTLLQSALQARGMNYSVVATSTNADVEATRLTNPLLPFSLANLTDVRLTDRDVILKNDDTPGLSVSNSQNAHFTTQLTINGLQFTRGWTSVDADLNGKAFRFVNTHLEVSGGGALQVAQGNELLAGPLNTSLDTILVCDCNSAADGSNTATYANLIGGGFSDAAAAVGVTGDTCCANELLTNSTPSMDERIDIVLTRGSSFKPQDATITGATPFRLSPAPLWASDHAGVQAKLKIE